MWYIQLIIQNVFSGDINKCSKIHGIQLVNSWPWQKLLTNIVLRTSCKHHYVVGGFLMTSTHLAKWVVIGKHNLLFVNWKSSHQSYQVEQYRHFTSRQRSTNFTVHWHLFMLMRRLLWNGCKRLFPLFSELINHERFISWNLAKLRKLLLKRNCFFSPAIPPIV